MMPIEPGGLDNVIDPDQQLGMECCFAATQLVPAIDVLEFHDSVEGMWATELAIRYAKYTLGRSYTAYDLIQGIQNQP